MNEVIKEELKLVDQLINLMIVVWVGVGSVALWFSLSRSELTGWGMRENVHIGSYILIVTVGALRKKLPTQVKAIIFFSLQLVLVIIGVLSFGFMAPAALFLPMICVILALFYRKEVVFIFTLLVLLFVFMVAMAFEYGYLVLKFDANELFLDMKHWLLYISCLVIVLYFVLMAIIKYKNVLTKMIAALNQQNEEVKRLANHDFLTGLPIIRLCMEYFEQAVIDNQQHLAVLFLDMNEFKTINDQYGHDAGDACLIHVAKMLKREIRCDGFCCRMGGDEFLLIIDQFSDKRDLIYKTERIIMAISSSFIFRKEKLSIGASIGIALYGEHGKKFNELKRTADRAMYQAKMSANTSIHIADHTN